MTSRLLRLTAGAAAFYVVVMAVFALFQRELVFFGQHLPTAAAGEISGEEIRIGGGAGVEGAYYRPATAAGEPRAALIVGHGNRELITWWDEPIRPFVEAGHPVLLFEYPGYGRSPGRPSRESIGRVAAAAFDWLAEQPEVDPTRIVALGKSLGGGVVADLSRARPLAGLILQSTFTGLPELLWESYLIPAPLVRDRFDVRGAVEEFGGPVLLLHGDHDLVIPIRHLHRLRRAADRPYVLLQQCGHSDCPARNEQYWAASLSFLDAVEQGLGDPVRER